MKILTHTSVDMFCESTEEKEKNMEIKKHYILVCLSQYDRAWYPADVALDLHVLNPHVTTTCYLQHNFCHVF